MISITAAGFIGEKPELLLVGSNNTAKCEFDVVWGRREYKRGEWVTAWERATFVAWEAEAEKIAERLDKGFNVTCTGLQETSTWQDKAGQKHRTIKYRLTAWIVESRHAPSQEEHGQREQPARQPDQPQAHPNQSSDATMRDDPGEALGAGLLMM